MENGLVRRGEPLDVRMRRRGRALPVAVVVFAAVLVYLLTLPPLPSSVSLLPDLASSPPVVRGAFHVHTDRSDGSGSVDEIAAAARAAGLQFIIFTDHGDGTRSPDPPVYRSGVLCLDAVEISTRGGHYIAVGLGAPAPYPLGGDAAGVVEDVRRLGGFGVVAHPSSPRIALSWTEPGLDVDGFEWLNADSQWRDDSWAALLGAAAAYVVRPPGAIASLFDRPDETLAWWSVSPPRPVVGLAGSDAHARLALGRDGEGYDRAMEIAFPGYEEVFRTFALRVELEHVWSGNSRDDARMLLEGLQAGRTYTAIDALATPAGFRFVGEVDGQTVAMGSRVSSSKPVELSAIAAGPPGATMVLLANGQVVSEAQGLELRHTVRGEAGAYRVEVRVPSSGGGDRSLPWIVGNPVYVVDPETTVVPPPPLPPAAVSPLSTTDLASQLRWSTESDATSEVEIDALGVESDGADGDSGFELRYRLGDDMDGGTYVAAVYPVEEGALARFDRVAFRAVADRPHRVSVQMRAGGLVGQPRWRTSAYIGPSVTEVQIPFGHVVSVEPSGSPLSFEPSQIDAILLVIDLTNSSPEAVGELTVRDVRLER